MKAPVLDPRRAGRAVRVRLCEGSDAFASLGSEWDDLVHRQDVPNPAMSSTWLRRLASFEPGVPLLGVAERDGRIIAGAAFGIRRPAGRLGPRLATWMGTSANWQSPDLLVDPSAPEAGRALVDALLGNVDAVDLTVPEGGLVARALRQRFDSFEEQHGTDGWVTPLPPARLEYATRRAAYEVRRAERRGASIETRVAARPTEIATALERAFELHRARWEGDREAIPRFSSTEHDRAWYRGAVAEMAEHDAARIVEVTQDGHPVAAVVGLLVGSGSMFGITAVNPRDHLREPGHVALLAWVREATAKGARTMDLGWGAGGPGSPKARLGPRRVPIVRLRCVHRARDRMVLRGLGDARRIASALRRRIR